MQIITNKQINQRLLDFLYTLTPMNDTFSQDDLKIVSWNYQSDGIFVKYQFYNGVKWSDAGMTIYNSQLILLSTFL